MDNNTTTLEGDDLLLNQLELVTPTTVAGTLYGIGFTLFCLYVHSLVYRLQDADRKRQAKFMLAYTAVIMLCGLYNLVANAWVAQNAYINHGSFPGGPFSYIESTVHTAVVVVIFACEQAIDILTSAIQIWRVWVVWSATRHAKLIIILPMLCFLTFTALKLRTVILDTTVSLAKDVELDLKTYTAEIAIQGATTIICTMLISLFLVFQQWRQRKLIGKSQGSVGYMNIVAMLVESYMLESVWLLALAVLNNSSAVGNFFSETQTYIEIIAYLLVQYRVANGKAYESQRGQSHMSSLHWNHSDHITTQFGATSEVAGDRNVFLKPEASGVLPVSSMA